MQKGSLQWRTFSLSQFFLTLLFFPFLTNAGFIEADPEVGEWSESYCSSPSYTGDIFSRCRATGGSPQGGLSNFMCVGGDPEGFAALSAVDQARAFELHRDNLCALPSASFSGYGHPSHSSGCWNVVTRSQYGIENWSTGNITTSGVRGGACDIPVSAQFSALRTRDVTCPAGTNPRDEGNGQRCYKFCPEGKILVNNICSDPPSKKLGCDGDKLIGNPCNVSTGNKFRIEADITSGALGFKRYYNSLYLARSGNGKGWRNGYHKKLIFLSPISLVRVSQSARGEPWGKVGDLWYGDGDSKFKLTQDFSGYEVTKSDGSLESYDDNGRLISETDTNGYQRLFSYNQRGHITAVTNQYGHQLTFDYIDDELDAVTGSSGAVYRYQYDSVGNVVAVIFPDTTPGTEGDNPRKLYHYEDPTHPSHLTGITDENGQRYGTFSYDSAGLVTSSELAITSNMVGQQKLELSYQGMSTTVTDAVGTQETWAFNDVLGVNKVTGKANSGDGRGITQTWDAFGNRLSHTDEEGRVTTYSYNATNQRLSMTEASGTPEARATTYEYVNADIDLVTKTISPSIYLTNFKEVVNSYDANQNITAVTINGFNAAGAPVSRSTTFTHDVYGKVTHINGPRTDVNDITLLEYYDCATGAECGQLKKVTNAAGHISTYDSYDAAARLLQSTDANGVITTYSYHPRGWLLSMTQTPTVGAARVTTYEYDNVGQLTKTTLPDGAQQNYVYDAAHDLREISDNVGNKVTYQYDAKGNRTDELVFDPDGTLVRSTITTHDIRNFINSVNTAGSVTQMINDAVGNLTSQTDPKLNPATQHSYDALDRLQQTVDALGNSTIYHYDVQDRLIQVVAPNNAQTDYVYDDLGNRISETSPDRGMLSYVHDAAGNVVSANDARGVVTLYTYDALNRVTAIDYPGTVEDVSYTYDSSIIGAGQCSYGVGRICEVQDNGGHKRFQYDAFGNVSELEHTVLGLSFTWQYLYDAANRLLETTYPSGRHVMIIRDAIGRLTDMSTTVDLAVTQVVSNRSYRGDGLLNEHLLGNGLWSTQTYDEQGRMIAQSNADPTPKSYQYDANGNIIDVTDNAGPRLFGYDVLDRLISADLPSIDLGYSYDANSNRLTLNENSQVTNLSYQANSNRLDQNDGTTLILDAAGNTLSDQGGNRTFEYNQAGRMSRVLMGGIEAARYEYDSNGLRIKKITPNYTTVYLFGLDGQLRMESGDNGAPQKEYLYADGGLVAVIVTAEGSPIIEAPADITAEATAILTPISLGTASAVDADGNPIVATPDNLGPYPLGETTIIWTATDSQGRQSIASQRVTVVDTTAPLLMAPADISIDVEESVAVALGDAIATDIYAIEISNNAPVIFPIGTTTVTWTALDSNGNLSTATQTVIVNYVSTSCVSQTNIALRGTASQSSDHVSGSYPASKANNGILTDFTHTSALEESYWELSFLQAEKIEQVVLHNRDHSCCRHRLRDISVSVEDSQGGNVYQSTLLNAENVLSNPSSITIDFPPQIIGNKLRVLRTPDPDLSGGGTTTGDGYILSLGEVVVNGCAEIPTPPTVVDPGQQGVYLNTAFSLQIEADDLNGDALAYSAVSLPSGLSIDPQTGLIIGAATELGDFSITVNVSDGVYTESVTFVLVVADESMKCSSPTNIAQEGTASQSSDHSSGSYPASKGNNGILTDFTHTSAIEESYWELDFLQSKKIEQIVLHNRDHSCCRNRLRDITVSIENSMGASVYESALLNPENALSNPDWITVDLPIYSIGNKLKVTRTVDPDLSGGGTTLGEGYILSLGEVIVNGCAVAQGGQ